MKVAIDEMWAVSVEKGTKIKVLIIDKHEGVRRALRIRLSVPHHLEVVGAVDGLDAAMPLLLTRKPDVIILGLTNGTDEELKQTARRVHEIAESAVVVIVLAPYADTVERDLLMQAGAKRYLLKHINSPKLIHEIETVTSAWHAGGHGAVAA